MASIGDLSPLGWQIALTNYAESDASSYHVWRISLVATVLGQCADNDGKLFKSLSAEKQQILNWQVHRGNRRKDIEVRDALVQASGSLYPYKNISTTLYDKVKSDKGTLKRKIGDYPHSAFEQISFRNAMLTKHSAGDGHPELLAQHDGLGDELKFLRWRSPYHINVTLCKPRPFFIVFWLIQWDLVGKLLVTGGSPDHVDTAAATNQGETSRPSPQALHQDSVKFNGVRLRRCEKRRKRPWDAQVHRKGSKNKLWLGSYSSKEEAARAADVGYHYYNKPKKLNFQNSPEYLKEIPPDLSAKGKEKFVRDEARRLAEFSKNHASSTWDLNNRNCNTSNEESTAPQPRDNIHNGANNTQPAMNDVFDESLCGVLPRFMTSGMNRGFQASTSSDGGGVGGEIFQESVRSWSPISPSSFTPNSHGVGVLIMTRPLEPAGMYDQQTPLSPGFDPTDARHIFCDQTFAWGDKFVGLETPGGDGMSPEYDFAGRGDETAHSERVEDWEALGVFDDLFSATHRETNM